MVKLLRDAVSQPAPNQANWISKKAAIAVPLKYLSNFCFGDHSDCH